MITEMQQVIRERSEFMFLVTLLEDTLTFRACSNAPSTSRHHVNVIMTIVWLLRWPTIPTSLSARHGRQVSPSTPRP